jgi:hypothetical protein
VTIFRYNKGQIFIQFLCTNCPKTWWTYMSKKKLDIFGREYVQRMLCAVDQPAFIVFCSLVLGKGYLCRCRDSLENAKETQTVLKKRSTFLLWHPWVTIFLTISILFYPPSKLISLRTPVVRAIPCCRVYGIMSTDITTDDPLGLKKTWEGSSSRHLEFTIVQKYIVMKLEKVFQRLVLHRVCRRCLLPCLQAQSFWVEWSITLSTVWKRSLITSKNCVKCRLGKSEKNILNSS